MNRRFALVALIFINILWGSTYAVTKVALQELSPTLLGVLIENATPDSIALNE